MAITQEKCEKNYLKFYLQLLLNLKEMAKKYFRLLNKTEIHENITRGWGTKKENPGINK